MNISGNETLSPRAAASIFRKGPWVAYQLWRDVIFVHWRVSAESLQPLLPRHPALKLDMLDGEAWVSLVGFGVKASGLRGMPALPAMTSFRELNLRTYITFQGRPGVCFLNMHANKASVVFLSRMVGLPYHTDYIREASDTRFRFCSKAPDNIVDISWRTAGDSLKPVPDQWLTERYFCVQQNRRDVDLFPVRHRPWQIEQVSLEPLFLNYKMDELQLTGRTFSHAHFSKGVDAHFWMKQKV